MTPDLQSRTRVLVVEDEIIVRMNAVSALEDDGFDVIEAETGDEALAMVEQGSLVDILFTDVNMPGTLDGLALAGRVCIRLPDVRVVVASGRPFPGGALPCAGRFMTKPYRLAELSSLIRELAVRR